jgi:hypothetical protein
LNPSDADLKYGSKTYNRRTPLIGRRFLLSKRAVKHREEHIYIDGAVAGASFMLAAAPTEKDGNPKLFH